MTESALEIDDGWSKPSSWSEEEGNSRRHMDAVWRLLMVVVAAEIIRVASRHVVLVLVACVPGKCMRVVRDIPTVFTSPPDIRKERTWMADGVYGTETVGWRVYGYWVSHKHPGVCIRRTVVWTLGIGAGSWVGV